MTILRVIVIVLRGGRGRCGRRRALATHTATTTTSRDDAYSTIAPLSRGRGTLEVIRLAPLDEQIDQHRPSTLAIIVGHVVVDLGGKVQQQVPRVPRNRSLVVLLRIREQT